MSPVEADSYVERGCTVAYLAVDGQFAGYIALSGYIAGKVKKSRQALCAKGPACSADWRS